MPRRKLTRIATGIYRDAYGLRAVVHLSTGRTEKRFPAHTPLATIKAWRENEARTIRKRQPVEGTLEQDVEAYLAVCTLASKASQRSNLRAWVKAFPDLRRDQITAAMVSKTVAEWTGGNGRKGEVTGSNIFSPWTVRHRVQALRSLYRWLNAPPPLDLVHLGKKPAGRPVFVVADTILAVAEKLADRPTRARFLVLATHGVRPCELMRAQPDDVNLQAKLWPVRTAKGGVSRVLHLNTPEMVYAWEAFLAADAWGPYDTTRYARRLRAAGWPTGVRPYALRGTWAMDMSRRGVSLRTLQELLGHASIETTAVYYLAPDDSELAAATRGTAGRLALPTKCPNKGERQGGRKRSGRSRILRKTHAPVAQLDRALASGAKGRSENDPETSDN
jgi:integrase